jgi:transposase, IS5 family
MRLQTLAMAADQGACFETHRKRTRRDEFLDIMNAIVPWAELCAVVEPHYPKRGNGRPPIGPERTPRVHFIQPWFSLADFAREETLYDSASLRRFVRIDLRL